jgi:hypothetical protein
MLVIGVATFVPFLYESLFGRKQPALSRFNMNKDWDDVDGTSRPPHEHNALCNFLDEYYENEKARGHRISQIGEEHLAKKKKD